MFLPWVFTGSGVSTTPQRLWPAAPWTGTVQGQKKGKHLIKHVARPQGAAGCHCHPPRPPKGSGAFMYFRPSQKANMRKKRTTPVRINRAIDTGSPGGPVPQCTTWPRQVMLKATHAENNLQHVSAMKTTTVCQNNHHSATLLFRTASLQHGEPNVREPSRTVSFVNCENNNCCMQWETRQMLLPRTRAPLRTGTVA